MDLLVLDTNLITIGNIDAFDSFIWTDRYHKYGDFELVLPKELTDASIISINNYLYNPYSEHVMIIEKIELKTDTEDGASYIISGRSLESILDRRVVWVQTIIDSQTTNGFQNGVKRLLNEAIISPSIAARKIDNFTFKESTDTTITNLTLSAQYTGDNLYDVICELCGSSNIGYKITLTDDNKFEFELYSGVDRSYSQVANPYVVFSSEMGTLLTSEFVDDISTLKNVSLIGGEGEGTARKYTTVGNENSGMSRRELFTDARDLSTDTDSGTLSTAEYNSQLQERGKEDLSENKETKEFECELSPNSVYEYKIDYNMGDIVQVVDDFGTEYPARIVEYVYSYDSNGISEYPSFEIITEEE